MLDNLLEYGWSKAGHGFTDATCFYETTDSRMNPTTCYVHNEDGITIKFIHKKAQVTGIWLIIQAPPELVVVWKLNR